MHLQDISTSNHWKRKNCSWTHSEYQELKGKNYDLVQIHLQKVSGEECFNLQALWFPAICSSLPNSVSLEQFPSLLKFDLTDPSSSSSEEIDMLIGSDYYWNIVGEVI